MKRKPNHRYDETGKAFLGVLIYLFVFVYGMRDIYRRSTIETISYIICMGSGWCLIPCANFLQYRSYYKWIDCLDEWNPLYVRGYFRKQAGKSCVWADLKGLFCCQKAILICWILFLLYEIVFRNYLTSFYSEYIFYGFEIVLGPFFLIWLGCRGYYIWRYCADFRYTQNSKGIWQPFSNMARIPGCGCYRPFDCWYHVSEEKIQNRIKASSDKEGYQLLYSFETKDNKESGDIYLRLQNKELQFVFYVRMKEYSLENIKKLNNIFSEFWMENIEEKYNTESASINILFQIDEPDRELNRRLFGVFSVAQKKGRNRLVSVLTYSGKPVLRILDSYGIWRGKKKYCEMRKDFLKLMGLREQDNHRSYWGDEEDYKILP